MTPLLRFGTLAAALLGSLLGIVLIFPLALVAPVAIVYPLGLGVAALLAALAAGWADMFLAGNAAGQATRPRLLPVVGVAEATAAVVAALLVGTLALGERLRPRVFAPPPLAIGLTCGVLLALAASLATWRYRGARTARGEEARLTVALLVSAPIVVVGVLVLSAFFGLTGA